MEEPVRVLLLEMPQLLRGILEQAVQIHGDCTLVNGTGRAFAALSEQVTPPDIVILGLTAAEDAMLVLAVLARWPRAHVMTVTQAGEDAAAYELRPRRIALGQMSPAEIVDTLRDAVHRSRQAPYE